MRMYQTNFKRFHIGINNYNAPEEFYNDTPFIEAFGMRFDISAGNDDAVIVYHDQETVYIVTENKRIDYIGLECFDRKDATKYFEVFFQQECETKEWLLKISRYPTKIRHMMEWL